MKTTLLILSIMIGTLGTSLLRQDGKIFQNKNHQRVTHVVPANIKDCTPWNSRLLVKADSSNNYLYIVGKQSFSDKSQQLSENHFVKNHGNILNVDKKVNEQLTENLNEGYLDKKNMNRNNVSCS